MDDFQKDLEDYFCRFTFGQFVTLILLEIVTLFFVFYLGARYGRDLLGGPKAAQTESVLPKDGPRNVDDIVNNGSVGYTYPEVLTGNPKGTAAQAIRIKPSGLTAEEYEKQSRHPVAQQPEAPSAEVRAEPIAGQPEAKPVPSNNVESASAAPDGKFAIQAGSYQSEEEARAALKRWQGKGYQAFMTVADIPSKGIWYRVRIGGFGDRASADDFLQKFKAKEKASALVVTN